MISVAERSVHRRWSYFLNPVSIVFHLLQYRDLIKQLARREVLYRYKGSYFGITWAFIQPLFKLAVYTFVFSVIFENKWGISPQEGRLGFAMALFVGILTFNILEEVGNAAPTLILNHANYVKKVIFPLEILLVVKQIGTLIHSLFGMVILIAGLIMVNHQLNWTIIMLPLVWFPMVMLSLGLGYFLSSIGVFVRDVGATVGIFITMLFFLSPIFYPLKAVPEDLRIFCQLNPIAIFVEDARRVVLWGQYPHWPWFFAGLVFSTLVFVFGFIWFMRSKNAFADVM
ncbi:MAG: ABC transporter permease [Thermodesulfobacteriota bacterium]|nr:ABC transporter permease [Thermodesulfobacteriota bacterium]